jgi:hypothetical protein
VDAVGVGAQQWLAAAVEAVAWMALLDAAGAGGVELGGADAEHVDDDPVVDEVLEGALLDADPRVEVLGDGVEHVVAEDLGER